SVSAGLRGVRWTSRTPCRSSSWASLRLTVDFGSPSCSAAPVKLRVSATFVKTRMSFRSMAAADSSRATQGAVSRLGELHAKVEAFFARVEARHGDDMQCRTGCADCCRVRLTITGVEAAAIRAEVARWPAARRRALAAD